MRRIFSLSSIGPVRIVYGIVVCIFLIILVGIGIAYLSVRWSLADNETEAEVIGLSAPITVARDRFGVPDIIAQSKTDAIRALGYVTARDRLFQMDLLRRKSAGRLAEIFGSTILPHDRKKRVYGFEHVAKQVISRLPVDQMELLQAYADGVNSAIDSMTIAPFEFILLGYRPDYWRPEDSLLVVLDMFETLNGSAAQERMLSVMAHALPAQVYNFLTPKTDRYTQAVLGEEIPSINDYPIPADSLAALFSADSSKVHANLVRSSYMQPGSNAWAVSGAKTSDGRAILANDMHLAISVPNIWYRCQLQYGRQMIAGVNLPGTPLIVAGATKHLAWGSTALAADILDLVKIEINPNNSEEYLTRDGWVRFGTRREKIQINGESPQEIIVKTTMWGPVSEQSLLEWPVAIKWTALDPDAINLEFLNIDQMQTLEDGVALINRTGGPPLNMILADNIGQIGWTVMGRIPIRSGTQEFDGSISHSWANDSLGWVGYIPPEKLPRLAESGQQFVVNANNRSINQDYPYSIGIAFADGYRAYRIAERLRELDNISEEDMFHLQLDTVSEAYSIYRDIALAVLSPGTLAGQPDRIALRNHLLDWNGIAEPDSLGLGLIKKFRENLIKAVFEPLLQSCHVLDANFQYSWAYLDVPLQALINTGDLRLLPDRQRYSDWNAFLVENLEKSAQELKEQYALETLRDLTWARVNIADYTHPLSKSIPGIGRFLDFPRDALPGCDFCVRIDSAIGAASMRLVVSPVHLEDGILHVPGGQSGHPFSAHYKDQHPFWVEGMSIPFISKSLVHKLRLVPDRKSARM